ncbi:MAG: hypothetical protein IIU87_03855 [Prevotella sp.]|nr:hypothetical protein [Prevotella sp.]
MNKWVYFGLGVIAGIVLTFVFAYIYNASMAKGNDGLTWFEEPGEVVDVKSYRVFQVIGDDAALVEGQTYENREIYTGAVYLLINEEGKYYYDEEIIRVPDGKVVRQVGIYKYPTKSDFIKTVPIIEIMDK